MDLNLKGKVVLVTGAGSQIGMGKAIAMTLAKEGCDVIVTDIDQEGLEKTAADQSFRKPSYSDQGKYYPKS